MLRQFSDSLLSVHRHLASQRRLRQLSIAAVGAPSQWNGARVVLAVNESVEMSETPQGTIVIAAFNCATRPDEGDIAITSGGMIPQFLELPALDGSPVLFGNDFDGNNLRITNISKSASVAVEVFAPGYGDPGPLVADGQEHALGVGACLQTRASASFQRLGLIDRAQLATFLVYTGPKAQVVHVNAGSPPPPPVAGVDNISTANNSYYLLDNWNGQTLYIANLSAITADGGAISLTDL